MNTRNTKTKLLIGVSLLTTVLGGCGFKAEATEESKRQHMYCTDTRDGERFSFKGSTIRNAVIGFSDSCVEVTTDAGKEMTLCKSHEAFIKCEKKTPNAK